MADPSDPWGWLVDAWDADAAATQAANADVFLLLFGAALRRHGTSIARRLDPLLADSAAVAAAVALKVDPVARSAEWLTAAVERLRAENRHLRRDRRELEKRLEAIEFEMSSRRLTVSAPDQRSA